MLIGEGETADAKRRLLERAGAIVVGEEAQAALAIVAMGNPEVTVARLKTRGILVNAVDRPDLCDFTLPAIIDRSPVLVAIGTGGASAGLAAALRQRLEAILPSSLGRLADALSAARPALRVRFPDMSERRRALGAAMVEGGSLDPLRATEDAVAALLGGPTVPTDHVQIVLTSRDPDDLTLRQARALAQADRVVHTPDVPAAVLDRARADALRIDASSSSADPPRGLTVYLAMAP